LTVIQNQATTSSQCRDTERGKKKTIDDDDDCLTVVMKKETRPHSHKHTNLNCHVQPMCEVPSVEPAGGKPCKRLTVTARVNENKRYYKNKILVYYHVLLYVVYFLFYYYIIYIQCNSCYS
jgi:hypothetical protein